MWTRLCIIWKSKTSLPSVTMIKQYFNVVNGKNNVIIFAMLILVWLSYHLLFSSPGPVTSDMVLCYQCALNALQPLAYQYRKAIPNDQLPGRHHRCRDTASEMVDFVLYIMYLSCILLS